LQKVEQGDLAGIGTDSVGLSIDEARLPRRVRASRKALEHTD
jgi:hypothetical protein